MMLEGKSCLVFPAGMLRAGVRLGVPRQQGRHPRGKRPAGKDDFVVEDMDEVEGGSSGKRNKSPSPQPHKPDFTEGHVFSGSVEDRQGCGSIDDIGRDLSIICQLPPPALQVRLWLCGLPRQGHQFPGANGEIYHPSAQLAARGLPQQRLLISLLSVQN